MKDFVSVFNVAFEQQGRARRREFWVFTLLSWIVLVVLAFVAGMVARVVGSVPETPVRVLLLAPFSLSIIFVAHAAINVQIRRLHDTGRSAWNLLWALLPGIGAIVLLFFFCQGGTPGANQYGPDPKWRGVKLKD